MKILPVNYYTQPTKSKAKQQVIHQQFPAFRGKKEIFCGALIGYLFGLFITTANNIRSNTPLEAYTMISGALIGALLKDKDDNNDENQNDSFRHSGSY